MAHNRRHPSIDKLMEFEDGGLNAKDTIKLFKDLVNTGLAWQLQGFYGRTANGLIESGYLKKTAKGTYKADYSRLDNG